jgi:type III secretory pathway component EscT
MSALALAAARMLPLAVAAPLGPPSVRLLAGGALAVAVAAAGGEAAAAAAGPAQLLGEALVGVLLGVVASAVIFAAQGAGALLDAQRRSVVARPSDEGGLGLALRLLSLALFAALGGPGLVVAGVARSYRAVAPGAALSLATRGATGLLDAGAGIVAATLEIAAPVALALWLGDVAAALLRRSGPSLLRGVGAPGGAAVRELLAVVSVLGGSAAVVAALSSRVPTLSDSMMAAARTLAG